MEAGGYDDAFDDGMLRGAVAAASRGAPRNWPRSVSQMRGSTIYAGQGMTADDVSDGHYAQGAARPYARRAEPARQARPGRSGGETAHSDFMLTRAPARGGEARGPFRFRA